MATYTSIEEAFAGVEWRPVKGYEDRYAVSADGRVWSFNRNRLLRPETVHNGYLRVNLYKDGKNKHKRVHCLVAETFIPNPNDYPEVHHKNTIKTDNRVENLEWTSKGHNLEEMWERRK